jgi:O-acetyl-ADP-ribose deacetylase (regulator of RNase III)
MPFEIVRNDITKMKVDAIVNAANSRLQQGGGVCGAIFAAAGAEKLQLECDRIGFCQVGSAVITGGYELYAKHIIHAVGPVWQGGDHNEKELLASCYKSALELALSNNCASIAFPLISSGIFGYPKDQALQVAISAIGKFLFEYDIMVYLVVFDKAAFQLSDKLFDSIKTYIDDNFIDEHPLLSQNRVYEVEDQLDLMHSLEIHESAKMQRAAAPRNLGDIASLLEDTFSQSLLRLIDEKGRTDVEVYKRANIDRKLFSKIRSNPHYKPSKNTALALAVALELNIDKTRDLLMKAGFALSRSSISDLIVQYFIENGEYDIFVINEALFKFDQNLLGA